MEIYVVYFEVKDYEPQSPLFQKAFRTKEEAEVHYNELIQHENVTRDWQYEELSDLDQDLKDKYFDAQYIVQIAKVDLV